MSASPPISDPPPQDAASRPPLSLTERISLIGLSSAQASLFAWAAVVLPWTIWTPFSALALALALAHAATALAVLVASRWVLGIWKVSALLALVLLSFVSWQVFTGGAHLAGLYGALGEGLFAALLAIWGQCVLLTLPTACWALVRTREAAPRLGRLPWWGAGSGVLLLALGSLTAHGASRLRPLADGAVAHASVSELITLFEELAPPATPTQPTAPVSRRPPTSCARTPTATSVTLVASFERRDGSGFDDTCIQADALDAALSELRRVLRDRAARAPIQLDLITAFAPLGALPGWLSTFELRPALDGMCAGSRCWMPWQLLARDAFVQHRPLSFIGDLRFGVSLDKLLKPLQSRAASAEPKPEGAAPSERPIRITTHSWMLTASGATELERQRPLTVSTSDAAFRRAAKAARTHIVEAQLPDGKFRYLLHPFSGKVETKNFNLARQAGTLLVLCELGDTGSRMTRTITRGLELLARHERIAAERGLSGLAQRRKPALLDLEDTALPLVALVECRPRVGKRFDPLIERLTRLVLRLQQSDGSFAPFYELATGKPKPGPEPLYAPGQLILGLASLELGQREDPSWLPIASNELRDARRRAMAHIVRDHWPSSLRPYFFVEENWHCLAARALLPLERDPSYERFCLDYVAFKSRLILEEDSRVDPAFVGGFGFGNVIPPHNTGAAGFGEAMAAAIQVLRAQGSSAEREQELLRKVLGFLVRQQWTQENCFGCVPGTIGAISEHTHSPITRIDFVQHAWAAFGHGLAALAPEEASEPHAMRSLETLRTLRDTP